MVMYYRYIPAHLVEKVMEDSKSSIPIHNYNNDSIYQSLLHIINRYPIEARLLYHLEDDPLDTNDVASDEMIDALYEFLCNYFPETFNIDPSYDHDQKVLFFGELYLSNMKNIENTMELEKDGISRLTDNLRKICETIAKSCTNQLILQYNHLVHDYQAAFTSILKSHNQHVKDVAYGSINISNPIVTKMYSTISTRMIDQTIDIIDNTITVDSVIGFTRKILQSILKIPKKIDEDRDTDSQPNTINLMPFLREFTPLEMLDKIKELINCCVIEYEDNHRIFYQFLKKDRMPAYSRLYTPIICNNNNNHITLKNLMCTSEELRSMGITNLLIDDSHPLSTNREKLRPIKDSIFNYRKDLIEINSDNTIISDHALESVRSFFESVVYHELREFIHDTTDIDMNLPLNSFKQCWDLHNHLKGDQNTLSIGKIIECLVKNTVNELIDRFLKKNTISLPNTTVQFSPIMHYTLSNLDITHLIYNIYNREFNFIEDNQDPPISHILHNDRFIISFKVKNCTIDLYYGNHSNPHFNDKTFLMTRINQGFMFDFNYYFDPSDQYDQKQIDTFVHKDSTSSFHTKHPSVTDNLCDFASTIIKFNVSNTLKTMILSDPTINMLMDAILSIYKYFNSLSDEVFNIIYYDDDPSTNRIVYYRGNTIQDFVSEINYYVDSNNIATPLLIAPVE